MENRKTEKRDFKNHDYLKWKLEKCKSKIEEAKNWKIMKLKNLKLKKWKIQKLLQIEKLKNTKIGRFHIEGKKNEKDEAEKSKNWKVQ